LQVAKQSETERFNECDLGLRDRSCAECVVTESLDESYLAGSIGDYSREATSPEEAKEGHQV
jgi:hypothetical protein